MSDLAAFLLPLTVAATEQWHWPTVGIDFDVAAYLTESDPPPDLVVSVRAIALRMGEAFVFESESDHQGGPVATATHVLPGGRRELGESPNAALIREILEETGCAVAGTPRRLGVLHLHHLTPRPAGSRYPYPDSLQWVFVADVTGDAGPSDDPFVDNGRFVLIAQARRLISSAAERVFLEAALANR